MSTRGFTLLEVIIAMLILTFLSMFTMESIQRALQTKAKVQGEIDRNSTVRDALRVMERDINMAFNYRDINIEIFNMAQQQRLKAAQTGVGTPSPGAPPPAPIDPNKYAQKTDKIMTQFVGHPDTLDFTTLSNVRMIEDSPFCSQAEIGYKLKPCRRRSNQEGSSNCLWRRVADYFHDDITHEDGQETVLLENVKEFKLRYLGPGHEDEWIDTWITGEGADDSTRGKFPYAVEITLEVSEKNKEGKEKSLRMTTVATLRNPNNPVDPTTGQDINGPANPNLPPGVQAQPGMPTQPPPPTGG